MSSPEYGNRTTVGYQDLQIMSAETKAFDSSVASSAFSHSIIRVHTDEDVWITFGTTPTAVKEAVNNIKMLADTTEYFRVKIGEKLAAIKDSTGGKINIASCD